ncbi:MAG TPA: YIP1 family protein [Dissulfurispiraceae bacterium]
MADFKNRIIRAAKLDSNVYEEVEADTGAMNQAMLVVVLSSLATGIGSVARGGGGGILAGLITSLAGWFIWAYVTFLIGTRLLPEPQTESNPGELLRTIGFSSSPGLLRIFGIVPGLTGLVFFITSLWMLAAMVVGVRQALDYTSTLRAVGVCFIGWLIQIVLLGFLMYVLGGPAQRTI